MKIDIGEKFVIRPYELDDVESLTKYANNRNVWLGLKDCFPHPYRRKDAQKWIDWVKNQEPETHFAIVSETEVIGGIGIKLGSDVYYLSGEIGYWIGEPFWGRGIATRAMKVFSEFAFYEYDLLRLHACIFSDNLASRNVLEKAGFTCEGKLEKAVVKDGIVLDKFIYTRINEDYW